MTQIYDAGHLLTDNPVATKPKFGEVFISVDVQSPLNGALTNAHTDNFVYNIPFGALLRTYLLCEVSSKLQLWTITYSSQRGLKKKALEHKQ